MYRVEDSHWWYRGMASISTAILKRWRSTEKKLKILDAGCGTGAAMKSFLSDIGEVIGLDLSPHALSFCRLRGADPLVRATVSNLPFKTNSFNLVTSFDVLYARTVPDVQAALKEFSRVLEPGGQLLLRLPAYDWLRGRHDRAVWTARRFTAHHLVKLLERIGLVVQHYSYANTILFPLALLKRMGGQIFPAADSSPDLFLPPHWLNQVLSAFLKMEAPLVARSQLPFGLSIFALAQKP